MNGMPSKKVVKRTRRLKYERCVPPPKSVKKNYFYPFFLKSTWEKICVGTVARGGGRRGAAGHNNANNKALFGYDQEERSQLGKKNRSNKSDFAL